MTGVQDFVPTQQLMGARAVLSPSVETGPRVSALLFRRPTIRTIRLFLGLTWIVAGALQYQPFMFTPGFLAQIISPVTKGQPVWVGDPMTWSLHFMSHHEVFCNTIFATVQTLIGVGLLYRRTVRPALVISFAWALGVWWLGEGLGGLMTGMGSPLTGAPGAVLLYALIGALVWPAPEGTESGSDPARKLRERAFNRALPLGRMIWAALWLMAAALWLTPANRSPSSVHDMLQASSYGWLGPFQLATANASGGQGQSIALGLAVLSALIGLGVLAPSTNRAALIAGATLSLGYWGFGQSFGLLTTGTATDVNSGPLFVLLALRLWIDPAHIRWVVTSHRMWRPAPPFASTRITGDSGIQCLSATRGRVEGRYEQLAGASPFETEAGRL